MPSRKHGSGSVASDATDLRRYMKHAGAARTDDGNDDDLFTEDPARGRQDARPIPVDSINGRDARRVPADSMNGRDGGTNQRELHFRVETREPPHRRYGGHSDAAEHSGALVPSSRARVPSTIHEESERRLTLRPEMPVGSNNGRISGSNNGRVNGPNQRESNFQVQIREPPRPHSGRHSDAVAPTSRLRVPPTIEENFSRLLTLRPALLGDGERSTGSKREPAPARGPSQSNSHSGAPGHPRSTGPRDFSHDQAVAPRSKNTRDRTDDVPKKTKEPETRSNHGQEQADGGTQGGLFNRRGQEFVVWTDGRPALMRKRAK